MIGSAELKRPPAGAALGMGDQPLDPRGLVEVEPGVDGVGVARLQQPVPGDTMRGIAVGDLQESRATFADVGAGIMVP
jgi:hypothetical protein